ncbi:Retrovirus-related Pol polyprotein from transposon RE1 [Bienertia sinuspersici]
MKNCKPLQQPLDSHEKLTADCGDLLSDHTDYQQLVGKLIYVNLTILYIYYPIHVLSKFMNKPTIVNYQAARRILRL